MDSEIWTSYLQVFNTWYLQYYYILSEAQSLHRANEDTARSVLFNLRSGHSSRPDDCMTSDSTDSWPNKFGKKFENFRQTLIRHFKKRMRKLDLILNKVYTKASPTATKEYKRAMKLFKKNYSLAEIDSEEFHNIFLLLKEIRESNEEIFKSNTHIYRTCNNSYIKWLFTSRNMHELYALHDKYMRESESYYSVLNVSPDVDKTELYNFIRKLPTL